MYPTLRLATPVRLTSAPLVAELMVVGGVPASPLNSTSQPVRVQ